MESLEAGGRDDQQELHTIIDDIGMGFYQKRLMLIVGIIYASEACEVFLLTFIRPKLLQDLPGATDALLNVTSSLVFVGMFIGSTCFGTMSDIHGRRKAILLNLAVPLLAGCVSCASVNIYMFMITRFFVGIGVGGGHLGPALLMELIPATNRELYVIISYLWWSVGTLVLCLEAYLVRNLTWQWLAGIACLPLLVALCMMPYIPESPRWLSIHGRTHEALRVLRTVANTNGKTVTATSIVSMKTDTRMTIIEKLALTLAPQFRKTTLILWVIWAVIAAAYYGMVMLSTQQLTSDDGQQSYGGAALEALGEMPAYIFLYLATHRVGRRVPLAIGLVVAGVFVGVLKLVETEDRSYSNGLYIIELIIAFCGRCASLFSFQLVYMYTPEVYPTPLRTTANGLCSGAARLASIVTPFVAYGLQSKSELAPYMLFMCILFIAGGAAMMLKNETKGKELDDEVASPLSESVDLELYTRFEDAPQ